MYVGRGKGRKVVTVCVCVCVCVCRKVNVFEFCNRFQPGTELHSLFRNSPVSELVVHL